MPPDKRPVVQNGRWCHCKYFDPFWQIDGNILLHQNGDEACTGHFGAQGGTCRYVEETKKESELLNDEEFYKFYRSYL